MLQSLKVGFYRRFYRFSNWMAWRADSVHDAVGGLEIPTAHGSLRGHLYEGSAAADRPLIIYFHGGGWVIGDLQTHHAYCGALARASGASLIAIDYRLAPEHTYPAAHDDCLDAATAIAERSADFGAGNGGIVLAGDSAGANLALCTALDAGDGLRERLAGLLLTYPVVDHYSAPYVSYEECATGQALTSNLMRWFWDSYLGGADPDHPDSRRAMPMRSDALAQLPPVILCTAGRDPLRDEGKAIAGRIGEAGIDIVYEHYAGSEHGFACGMGHSEDFDAWLQRCGDWIVERGHPGQDAAG